MFVLGVTEECGVVVRVGGGRDGCVVPVVGCTGKGDGHPLLHNFTSSSELSAQLATPLHRRSPSIQAP